MIFFFLFLLILAGGIFVFQKIPLSISDGSIIMASGILTSVLISHNSSIAQELGPGIILFILALLLSIFSGFFQTRQQRALLKKKLEEVIPRFEIGTWIAAISVTVTVLSQEWRIYQWMNDFLILLYGIGFCLWFGYFLMIIPGFYQIVRNSLYTKVHGGILLSCVATQSLVVGLNYLPINQTIPDIINLFFIISGTVFYITGFLLIIWRYIKDHSKSTWLTWPNTNCIIHGAMSITGLASSVSGLVSPHMIAVIWLYVVITFFLVEVIECFRMIQRIKNYGIQKGLLVYHPSQWARLFTFGMLVMFSMKAPLSSSFLSSMPNILLLHEAIIQYIGWTVSLLFVIEVGLFARFCLESVHKQKKDACLPKTNK